MSKKAPITVGPVHRKQSQEPILDVMDNNNGGPPSDWRTELSSETREKVIKRIMETRRKYVSISNEEGREESRNIAQSFEDITYHTAMSQSDYWKIITQWCLAANATHPNSSTLDTASSNNLAPGSQDMLWRVHRHWVNAIQEECGLHQDDKKIACRYCFRFFSRCWFHYHISGQGRAIVPCEHGPLTPLATNMGMIAVNTRPVRGVVRSEKYRALFDAFDLHESRPIGFKGHPLVAIANSLTSIAKKFEILSRIKRQKADVGGNGPRSLSATNKQEIVKEPMEFA